MFLEIVPNSSYVFYCIPIANKIDRKDKIVLNFLKDFIKEYNKKLYIIFTMGNTQKIG